MPGRPRRGMVFSKRIFRLTAARLEGIGSRSEGQLVYIYLKAIFCLSGTLPYPHFTSVALHSYQSPRLPTDFSKPIHVDLPISHAGAFVYWVEYDSSISGERIKGQEGYFNIDPVLRIPRRLPILGDDAKPLGPAQGGGTVQKEMINLPLNGLSILTVVSKWMGTIDKWEAVFEEAQQRGYTMLHYPPLQERGSSNSPYSIRKQLQYEPSMFKEPPTEDSGRSQVEDILKTAREKYGLLSLTDVVLNHTANDSPWLVEHPEAGNWGLRLDSVRFADFVSFVAQAIVHQIRHISHQPLSWMISSLISLVLSKRRALALNPRTTSIQPSTACVLFCTIAGCGNTTSSTLFKNVEILSTL